MPDIFQGYAQDLLHAYPTRSSAEYSIGEYIENFYNPERLHSHLDYVSPVEFELKTAIVETAAQSTCPPSRGKINATLRSSYAAAMIDDAKKDDPYLIKYAINLGQVMSSLLVLEVGLRLALRELDAGGDPPYSFDALKVGDVVPVDAFTSWDALKELLTKFNQHPRVATAHRIDAAPILAVRDALAHGRALTCEGETNYTLVRFSNPKGASTVRVEMVEKMTGAWLKAQRNTIMEAAHKAGLVSDAIERGNC